MKILGLDIATSTGWCLLEDDKLVKYGMINIPSEMNLFQRIKFFENNLIQILNDNNPDEVHIEDVILGISGAKTMAYLGRLNGVAISVCYNKVGDHIKLYAPPIWKAHSFSGLTGMAKKAEIQISVIKHFKLINDSDLDVIIKPLKDFNDDDNKYAGQLNLYKKTITACKQIIARKRTDDNTKSQTNMAMKEAEKKLKEVKSIINKRKKEIEKIYKDVSVSLTAKCGLTADVSDSIGIAYCRC